jgi:hypothetical protein
MQNKLDKLNSDQSLNGGINDWYIPSGGQLYNIKKYKEDIDAISRKLIGTTLPSRVWTSSEYDYKEAWMADFYKDSFFERVQKTTYSYVLVVKNIETKSLKLRL